MRAAIDEQNAAAKEAGNPLVNADALLAMAETIVPKARVAEWQDRAEAAIEQIDTVDLRDLRSVVTKAESAAKDEASRELAEQLRTGLAARLEKEQAAWLGEIAELLADDRVVRALNVSSRPPKAGTPLPRDLAERLTAAAAAALTDQIGSKRWSTVLEALALSPVHAQVEPASVPATPNEELIAAVTRVSMQVPQIAAKFGIEPKPAPRSRGGRSRPRTGGPKPGAPPTPARAKAPRIPPPPPIADTPVGASAPAPLSLRRPRRLRSPRPLPPRRRRWRLRSSRPLRPRLEVAEVVAEAAEAPEVVAEVVEAPAAEAPVQPESEAAPEVEAVEVPAESEAPPEAAAAGAPPRPRTPRPPRRRPLVRAHVLGWANRGNHGGRP